MIIIFLVTTYILLYYWVLERNKKKSRQCSHQTHGCGFLAPLLMESSQWTKHILA